MNPRDDISLHLSPVFTPPPRVVRNSLQSQSWGPEESYGGFPFGAGQSFEIMILIENHEFKIAINGTHFGEFPHRLPLSRVSHLTVDGDVSVSQINVGNDGASAPAVAAPAVSSAAPYPTGPIGMPMPYSESYQTGPSPGYPPGGSMPPYGAPPPAYPGATAYPTASYPQAGEIKSVEI